MIRHSWNITPRKAVALQQRLAGLVRERPLAGPVTTIAGVDCAVVEGGRTIVAAAVLCSAATMEVIASASDRRPCPFPYVPGLLSFRESPAVIEAISRLPCRPDLLMCDGQGRAHPRGFGLACHVGLWVDIPTIGAAKSRLCGTHAEVGLRRGCRRQLRYHGQTVGAVVRTRSKVKPVYVSVGHLISLEEAIAWTLRCARYVRLPEPTRRAHQVVTRLASCGGE
jgi:deoxyribonuclease V